MEITVNKNDKFSYLTIDNMYDTAELEYLWKEAIYYCDFRKLLSPERTGTAFSRDQEDKPIKNNYGVWLKKDSNYSIISTKLLDGLNKFKDTIIEYDYTFNLLFQTILLEHSTLMNYYENNCYYLPHRDAACYTHLFWLCKEPQQFTGGNLRFNDVNEEIKFKNNFGIIFPSWATHSVDEISFSGEKFKGLGRFCFSTFYSVKY